MLVRTLSYCYEIYINQIATLYARSSQYIILYHIIGVPNANTWMGRAWLHLGG